MLPSLEELHLSRSKGYNAQTALQCLRQSLTEHQIPPKLKSIVMQDQWRQKDSFRWGDWEDAALRETRREVEVFEGFCKERGIRFSIGDGNEETCF